jgi:hypothetical protein
MVMVAAAAHNTARQWSTQPREHFRFPVSSRIEYVAEYISEGISRAATLVCNSVGNALIRKGWDKRRFAKIASKLKGLVRTLTPLI